VASLLGNANNANETHIESRTEGQAMKKLIVLAGVLLVAMACSERQQAPTDVQFGKGGKKGGGKFTVTAFRVEQLDLGSTHDGLTDDSDINLEVGSQTGQPSNWFGCPNPEKTCNKLEMEFEGPVESIRFYVAHNVGGYWYSDEVENSFRAFASWHAFMPHIPVDASTGQVTVYWQGQRRNDLGSPEWDLMPDLDPVGSDDSFVFTYAYKAKNGDGWDHLPGEAANYLGRAPLPPAHAVLDAFQALTVRGRGKKDPERTWVRFEAQTFTHLEDHSDETSIAAAHRFLVTRPSGSVYFPAPKSIGINPDDPVEPNIHKEEWDTEYLTEHGCHRIDLIGVYGRPYSPPGYDGKDYVWDSTLDGADPGPVSFYYDASTGEVTFYDTADCSVEGSP
jgi:hypothetical protein